MTDLLAAVLALPEEERARVAHELLLSLEEAPEDPAVVERAWADEVGRRIDEIEQGTAELVDWETVRDEIRGDLAQRRRQKR